MVGFKALATPIFFIVVNLGLIQGFLTDGRSYSEYVWQEVSQIEIGCHTYTGRVICKDGSKILPHANVQLWEKDAAGPDLFATKKLKPFKDGKSATFQWRGCYNDGNIGFIGPLFKYMEVYYIFNDVCHAGDKYDAKDVLKDKFTYMLYDSKAYLV